MTNRQVRCAIYTRKSSEEGLEQSFNSLEAQREACQSFILSQKHEGWAVVNARYDDGGFSGGTMERPALKQLLSDIQARKINAVVVYKVDRLTRALGDFSKIIEIFDSQGVSFVSVTQPFNTTTSMGRLTLNVLLSFAQFEREVTGERIRDKIAASKKKGMWMGGVVPLGYECKDHRLIVSPAEADTVRDMFRQYLRLGCVKKLKAYLDENQVHSKIRVSRSGRTSGGAAFSRGALYHLLNNRVYIGEVHHRRECYPGQHEAIVPRPLWDQVAQHLRVNEVHRTERSHRSPSLLGGKLFDSEGVRLTPTHSLKKFKRYRYYTSQAVINDPKATSLITRLPAQEIEQFVRREIHASLQKPVRCVARVREHASRESIIAQCRNLATKWTALDLLKQDDFIRRVLSRVVVGAMTVTIEIDRAKFVATFLEEKSGKAVRPMRSRNDVLRLTKRFQIVRRGGEVRIIWPSSAQSFDCTPIPSIVKAVARARDWYESIVAGEISTVEEIAKASGMAGAYIRRILRCAMLSPQVAETLLAGKHRPDLTLKEFLREMPLDWRLQKKSL